MQPGARSGPAAAVGRGFEEHGITEFVSAVAGAVELGVYALQGLAGREGMQHPMVAGSGLMRSGEECVNNPQSSFRTYALGGKTLAGYDDAVEGRMLEGAHDGGADGNDAASRTVGACDFSHRGGRDAVWLVERQQRVEAGVAGG